MVRATVQLVRHREVVSGASTITMQLARLLDHSPRTVGGKIRQALLALAIEQRLDKSEILAAYFERVFMGHGLVGFASAAETFFEAPMELLSPAQAALLAGLVQGPNRLDPYRHPERARDRRDLILDRLSQGGTINRRTLLAAKREPLALQPLGHPFHAPHVVTRILTTATEKEGGTVRTTLDLDLQLAVATIVTGHRSRLAAVGVDQVAVVVLDVKRSEWLAWEGSGGFFSQADGAQIDAARTRRQPGSTLKPFVYALALSDRLTPATLIDDSPLRYTWAGGSWAPTNFDGGFLGPMRARVALASSRNVPAVRVLGQVGVGNLVRLLKDLGLTTLGGAESSGLALTLGAAEVTLEELVNAYAALARGGVWRPARVLTDAPVGEERRVLTPAVAALVTDILADDSARAPTFGLASALRLPFPAAVKTGTSQGYRDAWTVGYSSELVVGVWCGNLDGRPAGEVSGAVGAAPIWREVMLAAHDLRHGDLPPPRRGSLSRPGELLETATICSASGLLATPNCPDVVTEVFRPGNKPTTDCSRHGNCPGAKVMTSTGPQIAQPSDGDVFALLPDLEAELQTIELVAEASAPVTWIVDGRKVAHGGIAEWTLSAGRHTITACASGACAHTITIEVIGPG
jgi:penicillin-binding protein 1C